MIGDPVGPLLQAPEFLCRQVLNVLHRLCPESCDYSATATATATAHHNMRTFGKVWGRSHDAIWPHLSSYRPAAIFGITLWDPRLSHSTRPVYLASKITGQEHGISYASMSMAAQSLPYGTRPRFQIAPCYTPWCRPCWILARGFLRHILSDPVHLFAGFGPFSDVDNFMYIVDSSALLIRFSGPLTPLLTGGGITQKKRKTRITIEYEVPTPYMYGIWIYQSVERASPW
jgi:hypothetical protein